MCGIAGIQFKSGRNAEEKTLLAMARAQTHRGPDNTGIFIKGAAGFAHDRLSILDLSENGNQPYVSAGHVLVYSGEIYNFKTLKEPLLKEGVKFSSSSDTAVLFECLVRYGVEKTLKMIEGMFAFAFYDTAKETLYLCRDRFGIKPLVWKQNDEGIYWSSEVKAIAAVTSVEPDAVKTVFSAASIGDHSNEYTVFKGIKKINPGTYAVFKNGAFIESKRYHDICDEVSKNYYDELNAEPLEKVAERFDRLISESVQKMLISDAPIGAFVSGGVDSSLIAAVAAKHQSDFSLFTANVKGRFSEYEDAKKISRTLNKELHEFSFEPEMLLSHWARATYHYECPIVTHVNSIPFSCVAGLAREKKVKAVLTGEGSDELFLGYPGLHTRKLKNALLFPVNFLKKIYGYVPGLKDKVFPEAGSINDFLCLSAQSFERQILRDEGIRAYDFLPKNSALEHYAAIQMLKEGLLALMHRNDSMGMMSSIESRFPFLDEAVVRFGVNLPLKHKRSYELGAFFKNRVPFVRDKIVVRKTAQKYMPAELAEKKKDGFPMYGHKFIEIKHGYFKDGYVSELFGLPVKAQEYMIRDQNPHYTAKLVSIDIFGRIFAM